MKLKNLFNDDDAVSPVIGVILMVAITVILAAVIGSFVLGLGNSFRQTVPNANFQFEYENATTEYNVTATHQGGDTIPDADSLTLNASDDPDVDYVDSFPGTVSAGDSAKLGEVSLGSTVRVIWTSENSDSSQALATGEVPSQRRPRRANYSAVSEKESENRGGPKAGRAGGVSRRRRCRPGRCRRRRSGRERSCDRCRRRCCCGCCSRSTP